MTSDTFRIKPPIGNVEGVHVWQMPNYPDLRGRLFKASTSANQEVFPIPFVTFEHFFTESKKHVFRGMHFQGSPHSVAKIISVVQGKAIDFLFDMREDSPSFGKLQIVQLDGNIPASIYIPEGIAHGYIALAKKTIISYRMNGPFCGNCDGGFSGEIVAEFLPILLADTIRSSRDNALIEFQEYKYASTCDN